VNTKRSPFIRAFRIALILGVLAGISWLALEVLFLSSWVYITIDVVERLTYEIAFTWLAYAFIPTFLVLSAWYYFLSLED